MTRRIDEQLDALLHQPIRTRLMAFLAARDEATFKELKAAVDVTDGNLDAHLKKLLAVDYVRSRKDEEGGRSQTFFSLTRAGRSAFKRYVQALETLLSLSIKD